MFTLPRAAILLRIRVFCSIYNPVILWSGLSIQPIHLVWLELASPWHHPTIRCRCPRISSFSSFLLPQPCQPAYRSPSYNMSTFFSAAVIVQRMGKSREKKIWSPICHRDFFSLSFLRSTALPAYRLPSNNKSTCIGNGNGKQLELNACMLAPTPGRTWTCTEGGWKKKNLGNPLMLCVLFVPKTSACVIPEFAGISFAKLFISNRKSGSEWVSLWLSDWLKDTFIEELRSQKKTIHILRGVLFVGIISRGRGKRGRDRSPVPIDKSETRLNIFGHC